MNDGTVRVRVVVVEDEAAQRRQLLSWLSNDATIDVVGEAATGADAVKVIDETRPDLVLLDIALPEQSGLSVLRALKYPAKVVFTTAHRDYAIEAFELGAVDYLLKPFGPERLAAALDRARARATGSGDESSAVLERVDTEDALALLHPGLHLRDHAAEVAVPGAALDQDGQAAAAGQRQLGAHDGPEARGLGRLEEAGRAGHAVAVEERHGRVAEAGGPLHQVLG